MSESAGSGAVAPSTTSAPSAPATPAPSAPKTSVAPAAAPQSPAPPQETPAEAAARKYRVKWGEEEHEVDESELISGYQRAKASGKKFEEAARLTKAAEAKEARIQAWADALDRDPEAVLERLLGPRFDQIAQERIRRAYELQQMDPAQRQQYEMELQRQQWEQERQQYESERQGRDQARIQEEAKRLQPLLLDGFKQALGTAGVPATTQYLGRMKELGLQYLDARVPLNQESMREIAAIVREEHEEFSKSLAPTYKQRFSSLEGDALTEAVKQEFGEQFLDRMRQAELAKAKAAQAARPQTPAVERPRAQDGKFVKQRPQSLEQVRRKLRGY